MEPVTVWAAPQNVSCISRSFHNRTKILGQAFSNLAGLDSRERSDRRICSVTSACALFLPLFQLFPKTAANASRRVPFTQTWTGAFRGCAGERGRDGAGRAWRPVDRIQNDQPDEAWSGEGGLQMLLSDAVGRACLNRSCDVKMVQLLVNMNLGRIPEPRRCRWTGNSGQPR